MLVNVKLEIKGHLRTIFIDTNLLDELILNGTAKTKFAMMAFLYRREFVKKSKATGTKAGCSKMSFKGTLLH